MIQVLVVALTSEIDAQEVVFLEAPKWWTTVQNSIFKRTKGTSKMKRKDGRD